MIRHCDPDLAILQEADRPQVVEELARRCGLPAWAAVRGHSLAFLSRAPVARHTWHRVVFAKRRYLEVVLPGGARIFGLHLAAIHSNLTERRRAYEIAAVLRAIAAQQQGFHVIAGDFNTLAPGEELDIAKLPARLRAVLYMTGGTIRWRVIRQMLDAGYVDSYRLHHRDPGYSFPTWDPHVRLDYLFAPASVAAGVARCDVIRDAPSAREASDHFPLLAEIDVLLSR